MVQVSWSLHTYIHTHIYIHTHTPLMFLMFVVCLWDWAGGVVVGVCKVLQRLLSRRVC